MSELKGWTLERAYLTPDPNADFDVVMTLTQGDGSTQETTLTREQVVELMLALMQSGEAEQEFLRQMRLSKALTGRAP